MAGTGRGSGCVCRTRYMANRVIYWMFYDTFCIRPNILQSAHLQFYFRGPSCKASRKRAGSNSKTTTITYSVGNNLCELCFKFHVLYIRRLLFLHSIHLHSYFIVLQEIQVVQEQFRDGQKILRGLSIPDICHEHHERRSCKFFLARFNMKNWHFQQILREKVAFFTDLTRKIGVFRCKFYSPKILPV